MKRFPTIVCAAAALALIPSGAGAALNYYIYITAEKQGPIQGDVALKGREGSIMGIAFSHDIVSPRDPATGLATGKRLHRPVTLTIEAGKATPALLQALCNNEMLKEVRLDFFRPSATGVEVKFMTINLSNASISGMTTKMLNNKNPDLTRYAEFHEISLVYQKIALTNHTTGKTFEDFWTTVAANPAGRAGRLAGSRMLPARVTREQARRRGG